MAADLPEIDLRQLLSLTDDTGILQHSTYSTPNPWHGYCTDDNARALIAAVMYGRLRGFEDILQPLQRYLSFLVYAFDSDTGRFRNFMSYERHWFEEMGSEDSHARTLWALGVAVSCAPNDSIRDLANSLFIDALPAAAKFEYIRPWAYSLIGVDEYLRGGQTCAQAVELRKQLAERLLDTWRGNAAEDWPWWEDELTWGNAKIPQAMLAAGDSLGESEMVEAGLKALRWLIEVQTAPEGHVSLIGNHGWFVRGKKPAKYDQQPLEAHGHVDACLLAARVTGNEHWIDEARRGFQWFTGKNDAGLPLWNADSGGCHDGLHPHGVNANQGAESTLAYVMSVLDLHMYARRGATAGEAPAHTDGLKYGLIGASRSGRFCLKQCAGLEGLKAATIWNRTKEKADTLAIEFGMLSCKTLDEFYANSQTSFVHVATAPALHAPQATAALMAGKHVLVEKPMATSLEDADEMIQLALRKQLRLSVDFVMRFGPLWEPVATIIRDGLLGGFLHGSLLNCAGDDQLGSDHWFWNSALSGGIFVEHGVHFFDLLRSWLGSGRVTSATRYHRPGGTVIDQVHCTVRYGAQGSVDFYHGFHQPSALDRQEIRLIFERGEMRLKGWIADDVEVFAALDDESIGKVAALFDEPSIETVDRYEGDSRNVIRRGRTDVIDRTVRISWKTGRPRVETYGTALRALMSDFLSAVRDPRWKLRVTAEDGKAALSLALDATRIASEESEY